MVSNSLDSSIAKSNSKSLLFYRDLVEYTGGHQKVADYFQHLERSGQFEPYIAFSERSIWDANNPWFPAHQFNTVNYQPNRYNYTFLAGLDWRAYLQAGGDFSRPIINLIQHVRHADPSGELYQFLSYPAIRICVSPEVSEAILNTGRVNGPVLTIPNGLDLPELEHAPKQFDVMVLGVKQPAIAQDLVRACTNLGLSYCLVNEKIHRSDIYQKMAASKIAVLLPHATEGFYLPALEAMHFCDITIVPDCIGNRSFCVDKINCLMPMCKVEDVLLAIHEATHILRDVERVKKMREQAALTVEQHSLANERNSFLKIMQNIDDLWQKVNKPNFGGVGA